MCDTGSIIAILVNDIEIYIIDKVVLNKYEINGYDDSDFIAVVLDMLLKNEN